MKCSDVCNDEELEYIELEPRYYRYRCGLGHVSDIVEVHDHQWFTQDEETEKRNLKQVNERFTRGISHGDSTLTGTPD